MYRSLDRIYQIHCIIIIVFSYFNMYFSCYLGIAIRFPLVREAKVKNVAHSLFEKISTKGEHDSYSIIVLKPEYWIPPNYYFTSEKYIKTRGHYDPYYIRKHYDPIIYLDEFQIHQSHFIKLFYIELFIILSSILFTVYCKIRSVI